MQLKFKFLSLAAGLAFAVGANAAPIDVKQSQIKATFKQFNVPVAGEFRKFGGDIEFNAAKPELTKASVAVQTDSYDLGDPLYNKEVAKPDWFDSKKYPNASLTISSVKPAAAGTFQATGELTLRGVKKALQFPVKIASKGGVNVFTGQAKVKRLDFGVGADGDWGDESLVANEVVIDFKLTTVAK